MTLRRREYLVEGDKYFEPSIGPFTSNREIIDQILDAIKKKRVKVFKLGKLTATLKGNVWTVKFGLKSGQISGAILAIPPIVRLWLGEYEWEDLFEE